MKRRAHIAILYAILMVASHGAYSVAEAAQITLRPQGGSAGDIVALELGEIVDMEVVIDASGEDVTGFALFLSFDTEVFRAVQDAGQVEPFRSAGLLDGIVLLNRIEELEGETILSYAEAAGVQRTMGSVEGVVARFTLEVLRRPLGDLSVIAVVERGHNHTSHYVTGDDPGSEKHFEPPLGSLTVSITGFRILPLPDLVVVEGEETRLFRYGEDEEPRILDLDDFVELEGTKVTWGTTIFSELLVTIDPQTNQVTISPRLGGFGTGPNRNKRRTLIFTAGESREGLTARDTIDVNILARPQILDLPLGVSFPEDGQDQTLDLDAFVEDRDDLAEGLTWSVANAVNVRVEVDSGNRVTFSAAADWFGQEEIEVFVTDGDSLSDSAMMTVDVTPVNDPPVVLRNGPVYPVAGGDVISVPLEQIFQDVDDDVTRLRFTLDSGTGVTASTADGQLIIRGTEPGRSVIGITVTDTTGEQDTGRLVVVVLAPGESVKPEIASLPQLRFRTGQVGTLDLRNFVTDDDVVDSLSWTVSAGNENLSPLVENGVLLVITDGTFTGPSTVALLVTDSDGNRDNTILTVIVLDTADEIPPRITVPGKVGVVAGTDQEGKPRLTTLLLDDLVDDPNDADRDLTWVVSASEGVAVAFDEDTRTAAVSAASLLTGPGSLNLTVTDLTGLSDSQSVPVLVTSEGGPSTVNEFQPVSLDSVAAEARVDLDDFAFDSEDFESELLWSATVEEPGIEVELDPVGHVLRVRRVETGDEMPPAMSRVVLRVIDTSGNEITRIFEVSLPPVFTLTPIEDIEFFSGETDTTLELDEHVTGADPARVLDWQLGSEPEDLVATIDPLTHRVTLSADPTFVGSEILLFTATDSTNRSRSVSVKVTVRGRGLTPQVRAFPRLEIPAGETDSSIDLDEFVVDDDADELLTWTFVAPAGLEVDLNPATNELRILALEGSSGSEQVQFLVVDPAGNSAFGSLEVTVLRGGEPPIIATLPQILISAGDESEQKLSLDLFVEDADTADEELIWNASAQPGISARIEDRQLFLSVPADQDGVKRIALTVTDPQGNQAQAELTVLIQTDEEAPDFDLEVRRNVVIADLLEVVVRPSEQLPESPEMTFNGVPAEVVPIPGDSAFVASYQVPIVEGIQVLIIAAKVADRAGNERSKELTVSLRWMAEQGGSLSHIDGAAVLNVPDAAAGPGRLAILFELGESETPEGNEGQPVYSIDLANEADFQQPATLNLFVGSAAQQDTGVLRWDPMMQMWEELPTVFDEASGWLTATIEKGGLYRTGTVRPENRRPSSKLSSHPNPFPSAGTESTRIEYEVDFSGPVRLEIRNVLGQTVRLLVDEDMQQEGLWSVERDGRDQNGTKLASGIYYSELRLQTGRECLPLLLVR